MSDVDHCDNCGEEEPCDWIACANCSRRFSRTCGGEVVREGNLCGACADANRERSGDNHG